MKILKRAILCFTAMISLSGCGYLNVDPELGMDDEDVFGTYSSFRSYFDWLYHTGDGTNKESIFYAFPMYYDFLQKYSFSWYNTTDMSDAGKMGVTQQYFKQGVITQDFLRSVTFDVNSTDKPLAKAMFSIIRRCNITIANIDRCADATEQEYNDLLGQAYALRGFCHFTLCRFFGGMPYLDHAIEADESWDLERESVYDTYVNAATDLKKGYELMKEADYMRRNSVADLNSATLDEINGAAAVALYARALMYAACEAGTDEAWKNAADAAGLALNEVLEAGFSLVTKDKYTTNFIKQQTTNENIWAYSIQMKDSHANLTSIMAYPQSGNESGTSGVCPTQNFVDRYETLNGMLLITQEDRDAAAASGHYNEQDPYNNRDPRLDMTIVHDGTKTTGGTINIYYDPTDATYPVTQLNGMKLPFAIEWGTKDSDVKAYSNTGYYCMKYWNGELGLKQTSDYYHVDPIVRLAEVYLNYAEAVNEAYGPSGVAPGASLTALQAVNIVRDRVGMPPLNVFDKENARMRIRNERCVELAFEGHHYYHDIRRWDIAPQTMGSTLYGIYVEKVPVSQEYPNGKKYVRRALPNNRQCVWKDYMRFIPFPDKEALTMKNFKNWAWK